VLGTRHRVPESPSWACFRSADPHKIPIDPNGNLTQKTEGTDTWVYSWNAENQLTKVQKNSAEQARFAYDPLGRRVEKVAGGVTTSFTYGNEDILREVRGTTTLKYVHGPGFDEPLAVDDGSTLQYFQADGLGSVVKMTNAAGAVTLVRQYDAWGSLEVGTSEAGYGFTSREWDPETGLYYYRARYYDSRIGAFAAEDPLGSKHGGSRYAYVAGRPTIATDPSGMIIQICNRKWDFYPKVANHSYLYDPSTGKNCGRGNQSGKECPETNRETSCVDVPGTEGKEEIVLACCNDQRKMTGWPWFPWIHDCHTMVRNSLVCAGVGNPPPSPGGRMGPTGYASDPPDPRDQVCSGGVCFTIGPRDF
jgi:RHS repeat-associated protein